MRTRFALVTCSLILLAALMLPPAAPGQPSRASAPSLEPASDLASGVTRDSVKIGLHAGLTGASPVPSDSVEKGKNLFFRWLKSEGRDINGRDVTVVLRNDQYNPSTAVAVCKEMVEKEHVFMLVGFQGTDQMQACARYAASVGVPYVSPGATGVVLKQLDNYFATSMSWPAQSRLLADMFIDRLAAKIAKNGIVSFDTPNYSGAHDRFVATMTRRGATVHYDRRVGVTAGSSEARLVIEEMKLAGIQNVYALVTPVFFLQMLQHADAQSYDPMWTGIGSGIAQDGVANAGCSGDAALDGAKFLSPYPAVAESDRFDASFRNAARSFYPTKTPDDFMWQLWALDKVLARMLERSGKDLTRARFIRRVERADRIFTGVGPTLRYEPGDHFGARDTHVLKADCTDKRWHTVRSWVSDF